ncbi:immunoglobulin superfamily member 10 [Aulostomus maculatus]
MSGCRTSYLRRWPLRALLFLALVMLVRADCPGSCACYVPTEVHCTFRYLTTIPAHIQPAVERINLGYNSLTVLRENDLSGLENLELLMLHSNTIHNIEDRAFQDLKSLQVLKMSYNRVKEIIKDTLKGLESLQRLHMDHNHIEFISPEAFYGLTHLQLVHLEGNRLQQLHPDTFITLRHSQVFKVSSVRNIHLSDNLLTSLPADIFSGCSQLENVFLHGNRWTCDCRMSWFPPWAQRNTGVLKCKQDRRYPRGQLCPVCESPSLYHKRPLSRLPRDAFTCTKPWIQPHLKQKNISLDEGDFNLVSPKDFIVPLGSMQMNLTDQFGLEATLSCTVQRPTHFENLTLTMEEEEGNNVTVLTAHITTYLVCNIDYEHIQQLWQILATYSDSPMRLERGLMLARNPEMIYSYTQMKATEGEEGIHTHIEAEIKTLPAWLMQGEIDFQLDRTTTTFSTLHIKYQSVVNLRLENTSPKKGRYSWTMIKRDNQTKTEHAVLTGGVAQMNCEIQGEPKPLLEWILPDGSKIRAPYTSEDRRIIITAEGKLTLRGADTSDTGLYLCIATNYLDADVQIFRVTVLSPDVEETDVNGVQVSRQLGESLVFECSTTGGPEASVQWILPDHSILDKSHGNRKVYENGTLHIERLTSRDRGFYRCLVANHLGVDLLVSQVTMIGEKPETVTEFDNEGSMMEMEVRLDPGLAEKKITLNGIPSSTSSERTGQESRTITSDRPYSRHRSRGKGGFRGRLGQRRRGPISSRRIWSSRVFDKTPRKVDPGKFAEFMKKAQAGARVKTEKEREKVQVLESDNVFSGDSEIGSGEDQNEDHPITVATVFKPTVSNPHKSRVFGKEIRQSENTSQEGQSTNIATTGSYIQSDSTPAKSIKHNPAEQINSESDAVTPYDTLSHNTGISSFHETAKLYAVERTTKLQSNRHPVSLQLSLTDSSLETQLQFSGEQPGEPETSTGAALSFTADPNVTPMRDGPSPMELYVHTDSESQTTFTAVTTTERQQDQITFHTTQTIKSPRLPPGSTIISQQRIHIIPHKNGRGGGRRRTFQGRRRIIKPNKITDIQSFINRFKQPSVQKEVNATVPYRIEPSPESRPETSSGYTTSADAPEVDPTIDPLFTTHKELFISTTTTTTAEARFTHGRTVWNRFFGGLKESVLGRRRQTTVTPKTSTTAETTTMTSTTSPATRPTTTANSQTEPETLTPSKHSDSKESSFDDDYGDFSSGDFELTTQGPTPQHPTTLSSSYYSKSSTTAESPPGLQTLPSPPTVKPSSSENPDEGFSSGSGGPPDDWFINRLRPSGTIKWQGQSRRPFWGRRPSKTIKLLPKSTTESLTTEIPTVKTMETTMRTTEVPRHTVSVSKPMFTASRTDRPKVTLSSHQETYSYQEYDWSRLTPTRSPVYSITKTPVTSSTTYMLATSKEPYTTANTRVHGRPTAVRRTRPTVQSKGSKGSGDRHITFDTMTVLTAEQEYTNTPATYNSKDIHDVISSVYNHEATHAATKAMTSKPKIVGGNAASFTVLSNSDAFLPCEAVGNPQPSISWRRFSSTGSTVAIQGRMGKFEVLGNGTLSIQNANIKDRGQYLCLAENDHGSDKLLVTLSVVAYPSRILEPKLRDIKSHAGKTVEMKCKAEGRPTPMVSWILANRTQVRGQSTPTGRVSVSAGGTLIIDKVSILDRGHYKCIASNPAGADTATVRLQVVAAPPDILEEKRQQVKAVQSLNIWLPCTGQGNPQPSIHWVLYDGSVVHYNRSPRESRISVYDNGTLHIKNVTPTDNGKYECIATSSTGSERRVVSLTVEKQEFAPKIMEISPRLTEKFFGDQLKLNCSATGDPKPRIMWRLPSKAVVDQWHRMGSRIQILDNGTLIINTVIDKDEGDYLCVARNKIGDDLQLMKVRVTMKPAKIEPKLYGKKQVPYGNDLKVDCKASGAPKPEISWGLPDGTVVNSALQADASAGGRRTRRYTLFDNGTLYVNQVGMSEEGDYTCIAENQVGKDEMHVHITVVTAAPRIRPLSQTYAKVKPGGNIRFDCEATGEPKPKILWMLPTNDIIAASNERYLMHVNGSLDIRGVSLIDAGEYICMARNPAGENRKVYKLEMDGNPPVINGYQQNRTVIQDFASKYSRKLIECKADGDPTPTITWIMPDNIFLTAPYFGSRINVHQNGTLEIKNVRPTDSAEFICLARNGRGEAVLVVQLKVTSMLKRPIFKNPFNERIVSRIGKTVIMNCSADGHPEPEIIWTLPNGTRLTGEHDHAHYHEVNKGSLIIYNSRIEDAGKYHCGAKNFMGYIEKLIVLDIGQKPYILTRPRGVIRSVFGEPLFLHCLSEGSPKPNIHWTIPGGHTLTRPQILGRYQLQENGTLVVQDTTLHDRGNYICRAQNDAGEAVLSVPVMIIAYPPRITTRPPPTVSAIAGTPIQLNCIATGIPKPDVTWELPDHSVLSTAEEGRRMGSELLHPQGTLIIQRLSASDSGKYMCLAKNLLGKDLRITYVRVL